MNIFLHHIALLLFIYMPLTVAILSIGMFFIRNKRLFLNYFMLLFNMLLVVLSTLLLTMLLYPTGDERLGYVFEILFFILPCIVMLIVYTIRLSNSSKNIPYEETLHYYINSKRSTVVKSASVTLFLWFSLFQGFLFWSACNAYEQALEAGYVDKRESVLAFYSPFVKPIRFGGKRYSYRRAKYVDMDE